VASSIQTDAEEQWHMTNKEMAIKKLRELPDETSFEEMAEEIALLAAIREGIKAADEGRLIPHEEVERRVKQWLSE
jgi:predicted transcriptional regulator